MSKEYAALLAQVIPVVILAIIVEIGQILRKIMELTRTVRADQDSLTEKSRRLVSDVENALEKWDSIGTPEQIEGIRGQLAAARDQLAAIESREPRVTRIVNYMAVINLGATTLHASTLAVLTYCEIMVLVGASGNHPTPRWLGDLSLTFIGLAMINVIFLTVYNWLQEGEWSLKGHRGLQIKAVASVMFSLLLVAVNIVVVIAL